MSAPVLLDTCAAIWTMSRDPISTAGRTAIRKAYEANAGVYVSPFTAWEIGMLSSKGQVQLTLPCEAWFEALLAMPGIRLAPLTPKILLSSTMLPGTPPKDPADRIIAATARELGLILITRHGKLLDYARQGHLRTQRC